MPMGSGFLLAAASAMAIVCPTGEPFECSETQVAAAIEPVGNTVASSLKECLYRTETDCRVMANGTLFGEDDGPEIAWQKVKLTGDMGRAEMVMLFANDGAEVSLIGSGQSDGYFKSPELIDAGDGRWLLHVPGVSAGTGRMNDDLLYARDGNGPWRRIDVESWRDDIGRFLPSGFGLWKGVDYGFAAMLAHSAVWRDSDANCCPTGGDAYLQFAIENDTLVLTDLSFEERPLADTAEAAPCPQQ